jgi:hypothetical protein
MGLGTDDGDVKEGVLGGSEPESLISCFSIFAICFVRDCCAVVWEAIS